MTHPVRWALRSLMIVAVLTLGACGSTAGTRTPSGTSPSGGYGGTAGSVTTTGTGSPTSACSIPQNGGGDHDADNDGGPSDGDGCR